MNFITLSLIEIYFKIGKKFKTTNDLGQCIRQMIASKFEEHFGNTDCYNQIQSFLQTFENEFPQIDNLALTRNNILEMKEDEAQIQFRNQKVERALDNHR